MKLLFTLLMAATAQAATVNIALTNFTGTPLPSNTAVQLFYTNQPTVSGLWISTGKPIRVPAPYGVVSTNLMPGNYSMSVEGITWPQPLRFTVGTNASYNLTELVTNASVVTAYAPFVTGITNTDGTVTVTPSNGKGIVTISATGGGGPTNGITSLQATNIAVSIASDTNTALQSAISTASNTVFTAIETPGRTNTVVDGSVGLELGRAIWGKLRANTNIFKILTFGDSIGSWDLGGPGTGIHQGLTALYGNAGCAGRSVDLFGGLEIQASSVGANPAELNKDGPTNWWGLWHRATNGTAVQWGTYGSSTGAVATHIGFYWRAQPQGGSFSFKISKDGAAFTEQAVLDGYAAVPEARYTNWTVTAGAYRVQAAISTDVTNVFIGPEIYDTRSNGVVGFYVNKGGLNLSQLGQVPEGVWDGVLTNYNPDLIIYNMAEVPDIGETAFEQHLTNTWAAWTRKATNAVVWVTGQSFRGNSDDYMHARENIILRRAALANGWIYTDTRADAQSWERSIALGYMRGATVPEDIVHFAPAGAKALGWSALRKAGLAQSSRVSGSSSSVTVIATNDPGATVTNAYVQTGKIGVGYGTNSYPTASIFMRTPAGEEKTLIASPGSGFFGVWFGSPASYPDWDNYTLIGAASTTNKTVATGSTYLNVKTGGELALRYGNTTALWIKTNNQVNVNGSLSVGGTVNTTNGFHGSGAGITNIPIAGVTGLPDALAWLTNNTGSSTGAVSSVNGLTGVVTLGAADVGAQPALGFAPQPASENGTNWSTISTNVITDLRQEIADTTLDFVPQYGSANLTNLSAYSANSFLTWTNWNPGDPADLDIVRMQPIIAGSVVAGGWIDFWKTTEEWHVGQIVHAPEFIGSVSAANLTGTIDAARLGSGTANNTTVLYGDNAWRAPGGSSATVLILDCSTGLVNYALSERVPHVLLKSNATHNAEIVANGSTNTISGSLVWVDAQPVNTTNWIIKW